MHPVHLARRLARAGSDDPQWDGFVVRCYAEIRRALWREHFKSRRAGGEPVEPAHYEDLAQDVMVRLLERGRQGLVGFRGEDSDTLVRYIRRITANAVTDHVRYLTSALRASRAAPIPPEFVRDGDRERGGVMILPPETDPEQHVFSREVRQIVADVLAHSAQDERQRALNCRLFMLYFVEGFSVPEIAEMDSIPLSQSAVGRRLGILRRALQRIFTRRRLRPPPPRLLNRGRSPEPGPARNRRGRGRKPIIRARFPPGVRSPLRRRGPSRWSRWGR